MLEKEKSETQNRSVILENTIKILRNRLHKTKDVWYRIAVLEKYLEIDSGVKTVDQKGSLLYLNGYIAEGIFYTIISSLGKKRVQISTGSEDINGTDFIIDGKPFNVTMDPHNLNGKFNNSRPPNILLPTNRDQTLNNPIGSQIPYVVSIYNDNFPYEQYFHDTLSLNYALLREMDYTLNYGCRDSLLKSSKIKEENYSELEEVLSCLSTLNPSPLLEVS
jgi:hypothetical protein